MTFDTLLTIAIDAPFFAVFAFTLVDYLRHRTRVRLAVMLVFASLAVVLAAPIVRAVPVLGPVIGFVVLPALLAQPVLVLWLVGFVRPMPRVALVAAVMACLGLTASFAFLIVVGTTPGSAVVAALGITLIAYFLVLEGAAAVAFALAARSRAGASRTRLATAAVATALFAVSLGLLLGGGLANPAGSEAATTTSIIARILATLSAFGYLVAFAPPGRLRRLSQQSIVYDFIRDLNALPTGTPVERIWELLGRTAERASGAATATVVIRDDAPAVDPAEVVHASSGSAPIALGFTSTRWPGARLDLDLDRRALFRDDDLELIALLLDRAVRAAEREALVIERERLIAELKAASAAKSDFLAAMSHELRTPLNAIIGFSELLREGGDEAADPATVQTFSEHIHASGLHLLELVNDVLDLARVEAGRLDLKPSPFELDALIRQTVATMRALADQKHLALDYDLLPLTIEADPSRVRQIVLNLVSNAVKFTDTGTVRLSLRQDGPEHVALTVTDTGRGIRPEDAELIFEAFQQGSTRTDTHHEGTGLGLALTRQLVEAHGGTISVESIVDFGSAFTVRLPLKQPAAEAAAGAVPVFPPGKPSVLVIEDDPAAQELLRVHLEGAGYGVLTAGSGAQALAWLSEIRPDAVLLDIVLPEMDGWEVLQRLKAEPATSSIPVMVVSIVDDLQLGLALGAVDYLVKPVSRERLLEAIGRLTFTSKVRTRTVTALVIDGDPEALGRYRQLLEPDGFQVIAAPNGATGRRRAIDDRPDLIVLDALLPDVDGFELASTLHGDPRTAAIPVWVSTPSGLAPETKLLLNGNVQGVVARGDDALGALRSWLSTGRPATPAAPLGPTTGRRRAQPAARPASASGSTEVPA